MKEVSINLKLYDSKNWWELIELGFFFFVYSLKVC